MLELIKVLNSSLSTAIVMCAVGLLTISPSLFLDFCLGGSDPSVGREEIGSSSPNGGGGPSGGSNNVRLGVGTVAIVDKSGGSSPSSCYGEDEVEPTNHYLLLHVWHKYSNISYRTLGELFNVITVV